MPAGGGIWGTNRRLFDVSYYYMTRYQLEQKRGELQAELAVETAQSNRAALEIHIDRLTNLIAEGNRHVPQCNHAPKNYWGRTSMRKISVIGLGKLGSPMAAALASKGFEVIGVDVDPEKVAKINRREAPVDESGLDALLKSELRGKLYATDDIELAVKNSEITFIVTATPSGSDGKFSLQYILPVCEKVGTALKDDLPGHIVVVTSTVMPGDMDGAIRPALEKASGKTAGKGFGLCYNPEFIALGSVLRDMLNPDFVLIGQSDEISGAILENVYQHFTDRRPAFARMNFVNAELTKLALNTFITMKISYANMLAEICHYAPGADVDVVTAAVGLDSRVGSKYLKGGAPFGGPCFPRDNVALATFGEALSVDMRMPLAVHGYNENLVYWVAMLVEDAGDSFYITDQTYKLGTSVTEKAFGRNLYAALVGHNLTPASLEQADTIIVTLPTKLELPEGWKGTVIDCWRTNRSLQQNPNVKYIGIGIG